RAEIRHRDAPLNWVGVVDVIFEDHVGIARLKLQLCNGLEEIARLDLGLFDPWIINHFVVLLSHRDFTERHIIDPFDLIWAEEVHWYIFLSQYKSDIRYYDTK